MDCRKVKQLQHHSAPRSYFRLIHARAPQPERDIVLRCAQDQLLLRVLKDQPDSAPQGGKLLFGIAYRQSRLQHPPFLRPQQAQRMQKQG
ncbi:hypothetical protein D3C75_1251970 [compost metagenome]